MISINPDCQPDGRNHYTMMQRVWEGRIRYTYRPFSLTVVFSYPVFVEFYLFSVIFAIAGVPKVGYHTSL